MDTKRIVACISKQADQEAILAVARAGWDAVLIYDEQATRDTVEPNAAWLKDLVALIDVPVIIGGGVGRFEDTKKLLYAGADQVIVDDTSAANYLKDSFEQIWEESTKRFGEKALLKRSELQIVEAASADELYILTLEKLSSAATAYVNVETVAHDAQALKARLLEDGIAVSVLKSKVPFAEFKTDANGLVPCIVQDYKTDEVLMLAYMNEESYNKTLETGLMTYWTRSRQRLWTKGEESGHFSYVRDLYIDCDKDTILAKVHQIGPACHTGNRTCFYTELAKADKKKDPNPQNVLTDVYNVIMDRKENPREGSYTNYLFDKGVDKILKKVGEECTEIVIAAKNPDSAEIKYEIADFLYHVSVLMADKGVTWEDIAKELADRE